MTSNKQLLKLACSAALGASLVVALVGRSAAGGNRTFAGPPAYKAGWCTKMGKAPVRVHSALRTASTIPIHVGTSENSIPSGQQLYCTVTVQSVPCDGGYVQINCDTPSALSNSSGSWPLSVYFPPGSSTTGNFTLTANSVSTNVGLYYGTSDANPNDPADWTEGATVTITAG